jgi:SSS family transporter
MRIAGCVVFFTYLAVLLVIGLLAHRRRADAEEFHVAGRSFGWFPAGVSIMVTLFSAVNFTAFTGEVFQHGLYVLMTLPAFALVAWPILRVAIPFHRRGDPVSAYANLERRFGRPVRRLASAVFLVWRGLWMATVLYATARMLVPITGLPFPLLLILSGAVCTLYTATGGMRAVIWTDVAQFAVLFGGLAAAVWMAIAERGAAGLWRVAHENGLLRPFHPFDPGVLSLDPTLRMTLWTCIVGSLVAFLSRYGADQMVAQRYLSARTQRDAQRGFVLNLAAAVTALLCLAVMGLAMRAHAAAVAPALAAGGPQAGVKALARFILDMPVGVGALLAAGLVASSVSGIDSGIHSCSTAIVSDFLPRAPGGGRSVGRDRLVTVALGAVTIVAASFVGRLGSVFEIANKIVNGLGSPLLALFVAGWLGPRLTNARGVFWGGLVGAALSVAVSFGMTNLALHYYAVVNLLVTLALCLIFSRFAGSAIPIQEGRG